MKFIQQNKSALLAAVIVVIFGFVGIFLALQLYVTRQVAISPTAPDRSLASIGDPHTRNSCELITINIGTPEEPAIDLVKDLQSNADEDNSGDVSLGDTLTYSFVATNTGTQELTNVLISDPLPGLSALTCTPTQPTTLAPTETLSCTATYVVTASDVTDGSIVNTATATSDQVQDTDDESVPVQTVPSLNIVKSFDGNVDEDGTGSVTAGDTLTYKFTVTNTGDATLTGVTITDPLPGLNPLVCTPAQPATLSPGALLSCETTYVVTSGDEANGSITNTATGDSDQTPPDTDSENVTVENPPQTSNPPVGSNSTDSPTSSPSVTTQTTAAPTAAPEDLPAAGVGTPAMVGVGVSVILILGSFLIAI